MKFVFDAGGNKDMKVGDCVMTPRFCTVVISEVFDNRDIAFQNGYTEPTYYEGAYEVRGKSEEINRMSFAAIRKEN